MKKLFLGVVLPCLVWWKYEYFRDQYYILREVWSWEWDWYLIFDWTLENNQNLALLLYLLIAATCAVRWVLRLVFQELSNLFDHNDAMWKQNFSAWAHNRYEEIDHMLPYFSNARAEKIQKEAAEARRQREMIKY